MKNLLFMRHAKSSWDDPTFSDHDRPLNERGRRVAPEMGRVLREHGLIPDLIVVSSAKRAEETWHGLQSQWPQTIPAIQLSELYHASARQFYRAVELAESSCQTVLVIGHNPGLGHLAEIIRDEPQHFPTAAILHLKTELTDWAEIASDCHYARFYRWYIPRELGIV